MILHRHRNLIRLLAAPCYPALKAPADRALALVMFLLAAPVLLLIAVLVKLTSRGPAFYSQQRLGQGGRPYSIWKFRSMYHDCERVSGPRWSTEGDPRITPLGRFLRKSHLDELPQLWNVLRGEMSLVGPRPERPEFVPALEQAIPCYRERLRVRPGVTGLAQLYLPPDTDIESVRRKLDHDLLYLQQIDLGVDLRIMFCTGLLFLAIPGRLSAGLVRLPRPASAIAPFGDDIPFGAAAQLQTS